MDLHTPDHVRVICDSQPTHPNMIIIPFRNNSSSSTHRPAWSAVQGHNSEGFSATEGATRSEAFSYWVQCSIQGVGVRLGRGFAARVVSAGRSSQGGASRRAGGGRSDRSPRWHAAMPPKKATDQNEVLL